MFQNFGRQLMFCDYLSQLGGHMKIHQLLIAFICVLMMLAEATPATTRGNETNDSNTLAIAKMIAKIQPELTQGGRNRIARSLYKVAKNHHLDPRLMIAIIGTESSFANSKISTSGDLSMAQINPQVWNREFSRLGLEKLNRLRLKKDELYALNKMADILSILKTRHEKNDKDWFARYHSQTAKLKNEYRSKVRLRMKMIASIH
jgi:soluble lytic murein transglycosylase-like protein